MHDQIKKNLAKLNIDIHIEEKSKTRGADAKCMNVKYSFYTKCLYIRNTCLLFPHLK